MRREPEISVAAAITPIVGTTTLVSVKRYHYIVHIDYCGTRF
jgi:hypothetical protein